MALDHGVSDNDTGNCGLVGHSNGGFCYNNPNVTGLVYIAVLAPDDGQSFSKISEAFFVML